MKMPHCAVGSNASALADNANIHARFSGLSEDRHCLHNTQSVRSQEFYRIVVFNTALFGVGVYSALKSPFTSAFILEE